MTPATKWADHVLDVVDDFLQTVVVVDDRAFIDTELLERPTADDGEPATMGGRAITALTTPAVLDEHGLDAKAVTDAFAKAGLVCSLLSPTADEEIGDKLLRTARRADLVVLDWVFDRDEGRLALELIGRILAEDDQATRQRLRTIAVYTGQKDLHSIAARLRETLASAYIDCELVEHEDGLAMTKGPVRAAVFAKEHVRELPKELMARRVAFEELPSRLRTEFASLASGLVTTVALASLAALRQDTHRILRMLGPTLDAAFLGHRTALPVPSDAEAHAVALVVSEIRSVVEDNNVGRHVSAPILEFWLRDPARKDIKFGVLIDPNKPLTNDQVKGILTTGLGTDPGCEMAATPTVSKNHLAKKVKPQATKVFAASLEESTHSDNEFANRMLLRTIYSRPARRLQLGVIVRTGDAYRICVQPVCDSVRLTERRSFPFLSLSTADADSRTNFVVRGDGPDQWIRLLLGSNPRDLVIVEFGAGPNGVVEATEKDGAYIFTDASGGIHSWVGELKPELSQKVAVDLAQQFAQVAVDEAELLRLSRRS